MPLGSLGPTEQKRLALLCAGRPWTSGPGNPGAGARDTCRESGDDAGGARGCFATDESLRSPGGGSSIPAPGSGDDDDMVTRRFKKGTVYSALASQSGLDFSPVVLQATRPNWSERAQIGSLEDDSRVPPPPPPPLKERKPAPAPSHEKYPSWPVTPGSAGDIDGLPDRSHGRKRRTIPRRNDSAGGVSSANDVCFSAELAKSSECSADAYLSKYDEFLRQYQRWSEAPFLQRLYQEGERDGWPRATEAPALGSESACDSLGSSGGSSQDTLKWHGSYSDLSAFSASNGSSLFDSGHSTLPDSGRLSPQSSCDGSLADGSQRLVSP
ncbi:hypothetical protein HPB50_025817 [Hyalomma asiaticum]|uniref:Uncharacterized protein n=1 Tax=Hyalomma asiaticum TaxID=266040 RepID=A0ACB7SQC9_HYAAI|nr:hypothetical protein HPB50_025817 [Hyalomma asiaticum]